MKNTFAHSVYVKAFDKADPKSLIAGNRSGVGRDGAVLRKVKCEHRKQSRKHDDEITALRLLKEEWFDEDTQNQGVRGFIQLIKVCPLKVICFSEGGVRLWHNMTKDNAASWDATGGLIKSKISPKKRILYYEIIVSSSSGSAPVAFMISDVHTQYAIEELLTLLRHKEKEIFGHNTTPIQINSDRSLVLLQASMHIFNGDSMKKYLLRCWRIVKGLADSEDLNFCTIRACKSHLMKQASHICKQQYKEIKRGQRDNRHKVAMFIFSLLLNAKTLDQASKIVYDACIVLGSKRNCSEVEASLVRIRSEALQLPGGKEGVDDTEHGQQQNPHDMKNDDIFDVNIPESTSPFIDHFEQLRNEANQVITISNDTGENNYHGEAILNKLFSRFLPTIPIWSDLLSGDLQRFSGSYAARINQCKKSTAISEAMFKNTKVLLLNNEKHRLDECIPLIRSLYNQSAKDLCDKVLYRTPQKQRAHRPSPVEGWNRSGQVPKQLKHSSFQRAPSAHAKIFSENDSTASVPATKAQNRDTATDTDKDTLLNRICRFANNENNCWFNASMQSIHCICK